MTRKTTGRRLTTIIGGLICLFGICQQAQARPRDDAMAGAYRCAAIADSRQWLDCYYGAAQPARAALGMPPATPRQLALLSSPPAGRQPVDVIIRDQVMAGAAECYVVAADRAWLDCYYGAAQPLRALLGITPAPQKLPQTLVPLAPPPHTALPHLIVARMAAYSFDAHGIFSVKLDNGQLWRQRSGDTTFAHWNKPAPNYRVNITPGFLGSHNMRVPGTGQSFKVELAQ
jgi:hypothetical protein